MIEDKIKKIQQKLLEHAIDGWLLYDFRRNNDLACSLLEIPADQLMTRRFFYWIPQKGDPIKIVSVIEDHTLDHLPGSKRAYHTWQELMSLVAAAIKGSKKVAMEYSPMNALPYISKVDGGTLELVRSFQVDVVSSANLLQEFTSVWNEKQLNSHLAAAKVLDQIANQVWDFISAGLKTGRILTETYIQGFILDQFQANECISYDPPICALNEHSANPHFSPSVKHDKAIKVGDFILIDLWCKQNLPHAMYADITRVAVAGSTPTEEQASIFQIVRKAQKAGTTLIEQRLNASRSIMGWEVDQECRRVIAEAGFAKNFIHRTGHNIGESDHGPGAHLDNYETQDNRELITGTCFSIEPGIYLPGKFGVRLEYDVFIHPDHHLQITGGIQDEIVCLWT